MDEGGTHTADDSVTPGSNIRAADKLFSEIKDIRDELNILKSIANYQDIVQRKLLGKTSTDSDLAAKYIVNDIIEMDKLAKRIQLAVSRGILLYLSSRRWD